MVRWILALSLFGCGFLCESRAQWPVSFDLRDVNGENFVTAVKYQQGGTCWTHAVMAAMESNLLMTGAWAASGETGEPDLAEYHLDWWNGFNTFHNDDETPASSGLTVHYGGDYLVAAAYFARNDGAVRDVDGQSFISPPARYGVDYHVYVPKTIAWYVAEPDLSRIDRIKSAIVNHGAVGTCMASAGVFMDYQYNHFQPFEDPMEPNHAVAIVGWDDFHVTQAGPGAWLVKNSWGNAWGHNGYFWISYFDKHCAQHPEMGAVSFQDVARLAYWGVYLHDTHGWRDTRTELVEAFNAFEAEEDELLSGVSFFAAAESVSYTVTVFDDFLHGELVNVLTSQSATVDTRGYHLVELNDPVVLEAQDDFYLHLWLSSGGHAVDCTSVVPVLLGRDAPALVPSRAAPGQSFYWAGDAWRDLWHDDDTANFCIKGLTRPLSMKVTGPETWIVEGLEGGPFSPDQATFEVVNTGVVSLSYEVVGGSNAPWMSIVGLSSGVLAPGERAEIRLTVNAQAEALPRGAYEARVEFVNLSDHVGDSTASIQLRVGPPEVWRAWNFEEDPGWDVEQTWAWGRPQGGGGSQGQPDPTTGYTGLHVMGYNLEGDYASNIPERHVTTRAISCANWVGTRLRFWRWLGVGHPIHDRARVSACAGDGEWVTVWENAEAIDDGAWRFVDLDLGEIADHQPEIRVRWTMGPTDGSLNFCGWNLDDVQLLGFSTIPERLFSDAFEAGDTSAWSATFQ